MPAGENLKPAFLEAKPNLTFLASVKDDLFGGGGLYVWVKPQLLWPLSAPRRVGVEKGHPKTASLPPTMPATDNTLLSGMGGQWSHRRAGGGLGRRAPDKGLYSAQPATSSSALGPPPKSRSLCLPQDWRYRAPASESSSAHPLLCVSSTSQSRLFSCPRKATGSNTCYCKAPFPLSREAPPPASTQTAQQAHIISARPRAGRRCRMPAQRGAQCRLPQTTHHPDVRRRSCFCGSIA